MKFQKEEETKINYILKHNSPICYIYNRSENYGINKESTKI
jgi:hypothetical protein